MAPHQPQLFLKRNKTRTTKIWSLYVFICITVMSRILLRRPPLQYTIEFSIDRTMRFANSRSERRHRNCCTYPPVESPGSCLDDRRLRLENSDPEECLSFRDLKTGMEGLGNELLLFDFTLPFKRNILSSNWDLQLFLVSTFSSQKHAWFNPFVLHIRFNLAVHLSPISFRSIELHSTAAILKHSRYVISFCVDFPYLDEVWRTTLVEGISPRWVFTDIQFQVKLYDYIITNCQLKYENKLYWMHGYIF